MEWCCVVKKGSALIETSSRDTNRHCFYDVNAGAVLLNARRLRSIDLCRSRHF